LQYIQQRETEFAQIGFFKFLRDRSIDPYQRVAWFPCLGHFAMTLKDLNNANPSFLTGNARVVLFKQRKNLSQLIG